MKRQFVHGKCFIVLTIALLFVFTAVTAGAGDMTKKLKGEYNSSGVLNCVTSAGGFDPVTLERLGPGITFHATVQGIQSFDGKGGMTTDTEVLVVQHDPAFPVGQYDVDCTGTYTVSADREIESNVSCTVLRITPGGPLPPGVPLILTGLSHKGRLLGAKRGIVKLSSDTTPNIETYSLPNGAYVMDRICTYSSTAVKIWN